jgi:anti-anti-sigma factor
MANLHVLALDGEIDISQKHRIEHELAQIGQFGPEAVVILDLSAVDHVDTTFINALIRVRNGWPEAQRGARIRIVAPHGNNIWTLFGVTKLDRIFPLFENLPSAYPPAFTEQRVLRTVNSTVETPAGFSPRSESGDRRYPG